jgi:FkbM family methyltransferase
MNARDYLGALTSRVGQRLSVGKGFALSPLNTRTKMAGARLLFRALRELGVKPDRVVTRRGVRFELDLREGIDLSLYLAGGFQQHLTALQALALPANAVIFDVGANIGALSLAWAKALPSATVFAFEPTHYAFGKLMRNLALNEALRSRVVPVQTFLSSGNTRAAVPDPYASWRIDELGGARHPVHLGETREATDTVTTVDAFVAERAIAHLDLVKIDTDGHELEVLRGARESLQTLHPALVFEVGPYLLRERGIDFASYEQLLLPLGYRLEDARTHEPVTAGNLDRLAPRGGTLDVLAR